MRLAVRSDSISKRETVSYRRISQGKVALAAASALFVLILSLPLLALALRVLETRAWERAPGSGIPEAMLLSFVTTSITSGITLLLGTRVLGLT